MTKNFRVFNVTRGFSLKHKQALKAIEQCSCEWVEFGISVRDLTLSESIAKRNEQAKQREPLPLAEIPGINYQPPSSGQVAQREGYGLILQANALCVS